MPSSCKDSRSWRPFANLIPGYSLVQQQRKEYWLFTLILHKKSVNFPKPHLCQETRSMPCLTHKKCWLLTKVIKGNLIGTSLSRYLIQILPNNSAVLLSPLNFTPKPATQPMTTYSYLAPLSEGSHHQSRYGDSIAAWEYFCTFGAARPPTFYSLLQSS